MNKKYTTSNIKIPESFQGEKGWLCPRCHRVNAPWVSQCSCKDDYTVTVDWDNTSTKTWITNDTFQIHPNDITWCNKITLDPNTTTTHNSSVTYANAKEK